MSIGEKSLEDYKSGKKERGSRDDGKYTTPRWIRVKQPGKIQTQDKCKAKYSFTGPKNLSHMSKTYDSQENLITAYILVGHFQANVRLFVWY